MAKINNIVGNLSPFHTLVLGFLGAMTLVSLFLTNRGDRIPMPLAFCFLGAVALVLVGAFQSISVPAEQEVQPDIDWADKKKDRKEQKKAKKLAEKEAAAEAAEAAKAAAAVAKAAQQKAKRAQEKSKKAAAAAKAAAAKAADEPEPTTGNKKKKKKKAKKAAAAAAAGPVVVAEASEPKAGPEADDWSVAVDKFSVRKAKKEALKAEAAAAVGATVDDSVPKATTTMTVAPKHYKIIIGSGSKTINALQSLFDCKIQLPNKNSGDDTVTITGNPANLDLCKEAIQQLADKGYCKALSGDVTDVPMNITNIGLLIGPGGINVNTIQTKTGIKINLPSKEDRNKDQKETTITLLGDLDGIQTAMNAINQLMVNGFCDLTHPDWVKIPMAFPGSMLGILLGPKGANLRGIEKDTETTIKVPNAKSDEDKARLVNITILGAVGNVEKARARIAAIQTDFVKKEIDFPANLLSCLIGTKGESIRKLQNKTTTRINVEDHVWDPDLKTVTVEGFEKDCTVCLADIAEIVATNSRVQIEFPTSRIGILIGKAGSTIGKIKDETSTRINVANHEWDESVRVVSIDGLTDNVNAAAVRIEALKVAPPKREKPVKKELPTNADEVMEAVADAAVAVTAE